MGSLISRPKAPKIPEPVKLPEYVPPPEPEPVPEMPVPDDELARKEKEKTLVRKSKTSGRASTFLTSDNEGKLG